MNSDLLHTKCIIPQCAPCCPCCPPSLGPCPPALVEVQRFITVICSPQARRWAQLHRFTLLYSQSGPFLIPLLMVPLNVSYRVAFPSCSCHILILVARYVRYLFMNLTSLIRDDALSLAVQVDDPPRRTAGVVHRYPLRDDISCGRDRQCRASGHSLAPFKTAWFCRRERRMNRSSEYQGMKCVGSNMPQFGIECS